MIAQTIRTFDRSPVPARSAVAVAGPGSKQRGGLSDYITEFDPFAGVFTLFLHLVLLTVLFVLQLGVDRRAPTPPLGMAVVLVPEPVPEPGIPAPAPPPPPAVRPPDSGSPGKGDAPPHTASQHA